MRLALVLMLIFTQEAFAGGFTVGNGGDQIALEFTHVARQTIAHVEARPISALSLQELRRIKQAIEETRVISKTRLVLGGAEVDAINYPSRKLIEVSRRRWRENMAGSEARRAIFVLHEYLWIAGIDDTSYVVSSKIFDQLTTADQNKTLSCFPMVIRARDLAQATPDQRMFLKVDLEHNQTTREASVNGAKLIFSQPADLGTEGISLNYSDSEGRVLTVGNKKVLMLTPKYVEALKRHGLLKAAPYLNQETIPTYAGGSMMDFSGAQMVNHVNILLRHPSELQLDDILAIGFWRECSDFE